MCVGVCVGVVEVGVEVVVGVARSVMVANPMLTTAPTFIIVCHCLVFILLNDGSPEIEGSACGPSAGQQWDSGNCELWDAVSQ